MLMVAYRTDPRVTAALHTAISAAEREHEVAIVLRTPKDPVMAEHDTAAASFVGLDLRTSDIRDTVRFVTTTLQANPFSKIVVVGSAQARLEDQTVYFDLGRAGVTAVPLPDEVERPAWWRTFLAHHVTFDVVTTAQETIAAMIPPGAQGELLLQIAQLAHVPSVKTLADRLYANDKHSASYKRRRLWEACRRLHLGTPESVLAAARLQLLKLILDADQWTLARTARYFGADTVRNFNRSCKTRYGWSLREIRRASRDAVLLKAKAVYAADAPWTVMTTQL